MFVSDSERLEKCEAAVEELTSTVRVLVSLMGKIAGRNETLESKIFEVGQGVNKLVASVQSLHRPRRIAAPSDTEQP